MHFALPPKRSPHPSHYAPRSSRILSFRRSRLKYMLLWGLGVGLIIFVLSRIVGGPGRVLATVRTPSGTPPVVVVTLLEPSGYGKEYISDIKENRKQYAMRHGYETFFPVSIDYDLNGAPKSWAKIPAMRHAMTKWPYTRYFWYLDQNALVMNEDLTVESVMDGKRMDKLMIKDQPIVPPDSVIKTFTHLHGDQIEFVLSQDTKGLAPGSFILKQGEWAKFFLDTWFDPLYRSYNFQRAEIHALEHIVQWHPTILSKLALIPQTVLNSYSPKGKNSTADYQKGDFIIRFDSCEYNFKYPCETEAEPYIKEWRSISHGSI